MPIYLYDQIPKTHSLAGYNFLTAIEIKSGRRLVNNTAADTDPTDVDLANNDLLALVVTGVSGTPKNLSFTIFIDYTM